MKILKFISILSVAICSSIFFYTLGTPSASAEDLYQGDKQIPFLTECKDPSYCYTGSCPVGTTINNASGCFLKGDYCCNTNKDLWQGTTQVPNLSKCATPYTCQAGETCPINTLPNNSAGCETSGNVCCKPKTGLYQGNIQSELLNSCDPPTRQCYSLQCPAGTTKDPVAGCPSVGSYCCKDDSTAQSACTCLLASACPAGKEEYSGASNCPSASWVCCVDAGSQSQGGLAAWPEDKCDIGTCQETANCVDAGVGTCSDSNKICCATPIQNDCVGSCVPQEQCQVLGVTNTDPPIEGLCTTPPNTVCCETQKTVTPEGDPAAVGEAGLDDGEEAAKKTNNFRVLSALKKLQVLRFHVFPIKNHKLQLLK
jgi:hypothetical protein